MDEKLMVQAYKLKDALENDERVLALSKAEKIMENDEDVMQLSYRFSLANDNYNETLRHFPLDSDEARKAQKELYEAKKNLDAHPLVSDYLKKYQQVRLMYEQVDKLIFNKFNNKPDCKSEKR